MFEIIRLIAAGGGLASMLIATAGMYSIGNKQAAIGYGIAFLAFVTLTLLSIRDALTVMV